MGRQKRYFWRLFIFSLLTFCGGAGHLNSTGYVSRRPVGAKMVASLLSSDQITWHILKMIL